MQSLSTPWYWARWTLSETTPQRYIYVAEYQDDNGDWVPCSQGDTSCSCDVSVTPDVDDPGSITLHANPNPADYGDSVTLNVNYYDPDGTSQIRLYRGTTLIQEKSNCVGTSCTLSISDQPPSSVTYKATGKDVSGSPTAATLTVTVNGAAPVVTQWVVNPNSVVVGEAVSFSVQATDADGNLDSIVIAFGDGASDTQSCSGGSCSFTTTHTYTASGNFVTSATATDAESHSTTTPTNTVYVTAPSDADADGVPDADDACAGTPPGEPVVTTGQYVGCSCNQIINFDPNPVRDTLPCTRDTCGIDGSGAFSPSHSWIPDGGQPEDLSDGCQGPDWVDYSCQSHAVATTTSPNDPRCVSCTSHDHQVCWPDSNGNPYWVDSCGNREEQLATCGPSETCVEDGAGGASCQACTPDCAGKACGDPDGCGGWCQVESCPPGQSCVAHGQGYACTATCSDTCASLGFACGTHEICGEPVNCGTCPDGQSCQQDGQGSRCVAACTPDCPPDGSGYQCGANISDGCGGTCAVTGTHCSDDQVCLDGTCQRPHYLIDQSDVFVTAGGFATLTPTLTRADGQPVSFTPAWTFSGWMTTPTRRATNTDVGEHTVTVTARKPPAYPSVATTTILIDVACNPSDPTYGPCCNQNGRYEPDDTSCTPHDPQEGASYTCQAGACTEYCTPHASTHCSEGDVYYYNSCGERGDLKTACTGGQVCTNEGGAHCIDPPPTCTGEYELFCQDGDVWRRDTGCGLTEEAEPCGAGCADGACLPEGPCGAGTLACGDRCVDPLTDRLNCGGCGRVCGRNEQCVSGSCKLIPGCVVVCDQNSDCGDGMVCVQAGSCTESRCEPTQVLVVNESDAAQLVSEFASKLVTVTVKQERTGYRFTATNLAPTPLDVNVTATFSKLLTPTAQKLRVTGADYTVLQDDPILQFPLHLTDTASWSVDVGKILDPSYGQLVTLNITYTPPNLTWNETPLTLGVTAENTTNGTRVHLTLNPDKNLNGVSVPVRIPKCMAEYASQLQLNGHYTILEEDPLIVWQFDQLTQPVEITFDTKRISDECLQQLKALAYAKKINGPVNPWLAVLLIPLIGLLFISFQRFTPQTHERLSKKEFWELGKKEGESDEELERDWEEYKRRF